MYEIEIFKKMNCESLLNFYLGHSFLKRQIKKLKGGTFITGHPVHCVIDDVQRFLFYAFYHY